MIFKNLINDIDSIIENNQVSKYIHSQQTNDKDHTKNVLLDNLEPQLKEIFQFIDTVKHQCIDTIQGQSMNLVKQQC